MKYFYYLIIFFLIFGCSFDNKTGIWKDSDVSSAKKNDQFKNFKDLTSANKIFNQIINIDKNIILENSDVIRSTNWKDKYFSQSNNQSNFYYKNNNELSFKSKKISRHQLNETFLIEENNLIASDNKGNLITIPILNEEKKSKFNFYKKKFKNIDKRLFKIIDENIIYLSDNIGYLYAYDYKNLNLLWAKNYKIPFRSNLKIIDNKIITINQNNEMFIINKKNGELLNTLPTEEVLLKNNFLSNIVLDKNNIYFLNTFGTLYGVDQKDIQIKWFTNLNQSAETNENNYFDSKEIIYKNEKIIVSTDIFTYVINSSSGEIIYKINFSSLVKPIITDDLLFTITKNNLLVAFDLIDGKILYSYNINQLISDFTNNKKIKKNVHFLMYANNRLLIFFQDSYVAQVSLYGEIKKLDKLPSKILSNPIIIDGSILYINRKNKIVKVD